MAAKVDIVFDTVYRGRGADQAERDLRQLDRTSERTGRSMKDLATKAAAVTAALGTAAVAGRELYQAIRQGAALVTAEQQFGALADSIDTTADALLGDMREATRGMITDVDLMASATEIMTGKLALSHDAVVRMSTVSGRLGWDMGVLAQTINNQSVLRLDNLKLAVEDVMPRFNELRETMSDKEAFGLAVIEAGEAQVELLGDAFADADIAAQQFETTLINITNQSKITVAQGFTPLINELNELVPLLGGSATLTELFAEVIAEQLDPLTQGINLLNDWIRSARDANRETASFTMTTEQHTWALEQWARAGREASSATEEQADVTNHLARVTDAWAGSMASANPHLVTMYENERRTAEARERHLAAIQEQNSAMGSLFALMAEAAPGEELINNTDAQADALFAAAEGADANALSLAILGVETGKFTEEQAEAFLKSAALQLKIEELGRLIADEQMSIPEALAALDEFKTGLDNTEGDLQDIVRETGLVQDALDGLDGRQINIDFVTHYRETGQPPPGLEGVGGSGGQPQAYATGTPSFRGVGMVGEHGPELMVGSGQRIVSTNMTRNITNNMTLQGRVGARALLNHYRRSARPRSIV